MIDEIFKLSGDIRYVAVYRNNRLTLKARSGLVGASEPESDKYEELLVNPTLLKLATQRGNIDCGGLNYIILRYGNFYEFVLPVSGGHVSVGIEPGADPIDIGKLVASFVAEAPLENK